MQTTEAAPATPQSFWAMAALTPFVTAAAMVAFPPTAPAFPEMTPLLFALGLYFAVCSTFFQGFLLYRLKVARAVAWYGEDATHFLYRLMGFGMMGAAAWVLAGTMF